MPPSRPANVDAATINLASTVYGLEQYLRSQGGNPDQVLQRAGLKPEDLVDPERRVPLIQYLDLLEICAQALGDPHFGLKFGGQYVISHAGVVGNIALASRTIGDAIRIVARYLPVMVTSAVYELLVDNDVATIRIYYLSPLLKAYKQKGDWSVAFTCNIVRTGLGERHWSPDEVLLPYDLSATDTQAQPYRQLIGGRIVANQPWAGIRFKASILDRPMVTGDAMLERLMRHYGDMQLANMPSNQDPLEAIRRETATLLMQGQTGIGALAEALRLSVRTLQRRLSAQGTNHSNLLADVRKALSRNLLANQNLSVSEIAFSLGYSEVSSFNHAFHRWFGQTPGQYRRTQQLR